MERKPRKLTVKDMERMNVPARYWKATMEGIQDGPHKEVIEKYIANIPTMIGRGYGLLLWGANGVGKTAAAAVIAKEVRRLNYTVLFVRAADYRDAIFGHQHFDHGASWMDRAREVDLLILDDLGKEGHDPRGNAERCYEDLARYRVSEIKPIIFTTNLKPSDFTDPKAGGYRASFISVLSGSVLPVLYKGKDLRTSDAADLRGLLGGEAA